jgi:tetrahydromethanopterin S-methyltransferase subunit G
VNGEERDRLIKLEATTEERWNNHDRRSDENWAYIKDKLDDIDSFIKNTPCKIHHEMLKSTNSKINWLWGLFVAILLICVRLWVTE